MSDGTTFVLPTPGQVWKHAEQHPIRGHDGAGLWLWLAAEEHDIWGYAPRLVLLRVRDDRIEWYVEHTGKWQEPYRHNHMVWMPCDQQGHPLRLLTEIERQKKRAQVFRENIDERDRAYRELIQERDGWRENADKATRDMEDERQRRHDAEAERDDARLERDNLGTQWETTREACDAAVVRYTVAERELQQCRASLHVAEDLAAAMRGERDEAVTQRDRMLEAAQALSAHPYFGLFHDEHGAWHFGFGIGTVRSPWVADTVHDPDDEFPFEHTELVCVTYDEDSQHVEHQGYRYMVDDDALTAYANLRDQLVAAQDEVTRLRAAIDNPSTTDFVTSVVQKAAHQRQRWPEGHDAAKTPEDWFWLLGYLAGKALRPDGEEKRLHRIVATAAACANWYRHEVGASDVEVAADGASSDDTGRPHWDRFQVLEARVYELTKELAEERDNNFAILKDERALGQGHAYADVLGMLRGSEYTIQRHGLPVAQLRQLVLEDVEMLDAPGTPLGDGIRALVRTVRYAWSSHDAEGEPGVRSVLAIIRDMTVDELWEDIAEAVKQRDHVGLALYLVVVLARGEQDTDADHE